MARIMSNTFRLSPYGPRGPLGLGGLGDDSMFTTDISDTSAGSDPSTGSALVNALSNPAFVTGVNSELLFGSNLVLGLEGKPQLNIATTAPAVNVGLTPATQNMVLLLAAGVAVALFMGKGKKGKKRNRL